MADEGRGLQAWRRTLERYLEAVLWLDASGAIVFANEAATRCLAPPGGSLVGRTARDLEPSWDGPGWARTWWDVREAGRLSVTVPARDVCGGRLGLDLVAVRNLDGGRELCVAIGQGAGELAPPEPVPTDASRPGPAERVDLGRALAAGELQVVYRPIVLLARGQRVCLEATLAWQEPGHGPLPPLHRLDAAGVDGSIVAAGRLLLGTACRDAASWSRRLGPLPVAVGVSGRELREPGFLENVFSTLRACGLSAARLVLEASESGASGPDQVSAISTLVHARAAGVRVHLAGVGRARTFLQRLADLPFDGLKLDASVTGGLGRRTGALAVATAVIGLARVRSARAIAAGVADERQLAVVSGLGFDMAQGDLFGRAAPLAEITGP